MDANTTVTPPSSDKSNKRPRIDNNNNNGNENLTKRVKREMPALEVLNYLNHSARENMLYSAIKKHDLEMVMFVVENSQENFDTVSSQKYVLEEKLSNKNGEFHNPVSAAVLVNSYEITEYFLSKKFQTFFKNPENRLSVNAIAVACVTGNCKMLQLLIDHEQEALLSWPEDLPLHILLAIRWNNYNTIEVLQQNGVDINSLCPTQKETALHVATQMNACDSIKMLIKLGANINILNKDNYTPLSMAVKNKSFDAVKELLNNGANFFIESTDNKNAVQQALQHKHNPDAKKSLLQLLALENNFGKNRIKEAAAQGTFDITVISERLMNELKFDRSEMLKDNATYYLLDKLLTDQKTKVVATSILKETISQNLDLQQSKEEQEKILKQNQEYITGMQIFSNVPDEAKRIILSFLFPTHLPTNTPLESRKAVEIADVVFSSRYAKK